MAVGLSFNACQSQKGFAADTPFLDCASIIGTTLGQPTFVAYFNLTTASNASQLEGAMNGLFQAGGLLGCFLAGWAADQLGRKRTMFIVTTISIVGGALQAGSVAMAMFLVARFVTGFGIGGVVLLVPLWQSEISPPKARGLLVGLHGKTGHVLNVHSRSLG